MIHLVSKHGPLQGEIQMQRKVAPLLLGICLFSSGCAGPGDTMPDSYTAAHPPTADEQAEWESGLSKAGPGGSAYTYFAAPSDVEAAKDGPGFFRKHWGKLVAGVIAVGGTGVGLVVGGKAVAGKATVGAAGTAVAAGAGTLAVEIEHGPGSLLDPNVVNENALNPGVPIQNLVDANVLNYDQMVAAGMPSHLATELMSLQHQLELWSAGMVQGVNDFSSLVTVAREARLIITLIDGLRESELPYNPLTTFTVRNILTKLADWIEAEQRRRSRQN
jgi:hypothetical protein